MHPVRDLWTHERPPRLTTERRSGEVVARSRLVHVYVRRKGRWQILVGPGTALPLPGSGGSP